jgi:hypothetical protein
VSYIEYTTLLAFKPFLFNMRVKTLHPQTLPYYVWPSGHKITSPCQWHKEPEDGCTCGVYSTYDMEVAQAYTSCEYDKSVSELAPVLGVIQVLGKTIEKDMTLRSWGAYLWGLVRPRFMDDKMFEDDVVLPLFMNGFRPVVYDNVSFAWMDVSITLKRYNIGE